MLKHKFSMGYRIALRGQGYRGPVSRDENLFYFFDVLRLFEALIVYVPFWPGRFFEPEENILCPFTHGIPVAGKHLFWL